MATKKDQVIETQHDSQKGNEIYILSYPTTKYGTVETFAKETWNDYPSEATNYYEHLAEFVQRIQSLVELKKATHVACGEKAWRLLFAHQKLIKAKVYCTHQDSTLIKICHGY